MPDISSKMKLRAQILRILNKYRNNCEIQDECVSEDISFLKQIEDKKFVAKLLFQELANEESDKFVNVCSIFLLETVDKQAFEDYAFDFLQNRDYPDTKKFLVISLIKQKGIYFDYDSIDSYIKNPEDAVQDGVKNFLSNIIKDPEVQIDLIDFYTNISKEERFFLLNNLSEETNPDSIGFAMSILVQLENSKDEFEILKNAILKINSPYLIEGIEYILGNSKINLKERQKFKNKLKKLQEENPDFVNNLCIKGSVIQDSIISFIDGNSEFSLILSRKMADNSINVLLLTINTKLGITACMGFGNISLSGYTTIKRRLFTDSPPVKINPVALKALFKHYKNKNRKTKTPLPSELIVWERILSDIGEINYDLSEFLNSKLTTVNLTKPKVIKFLSNKVAETWYLRLGQNSYFDNIIEKIENEHILDIHEINIIILKSIHEKFLNDEDFLTEIKDRLLLCAYISNLAGLKVTSSCAYSLCFKNPYFNMLIEDMLHKSLYIYFAGLYEENLKQSANSIFKRGKKSCYNTDELEKIISEIEEKWL